MLASHFVKTRIDTKRTGEIVRMVQGSICADPMKLISFLTNSAEHHH